MSKFFLTNSNKYYQKAIETIKLSDFLLSFSKQINGVYACATKKLLIEHQNSVDIGDDFVMTNGTLLYKENNSTATWELIYDDYSYDIEKMRNQSCGNYAVCIKKGDNIDVWGEEFGGYDIYYYYDNGCYMVSNSLYDLAKTLRDKISVNKLNLVEEAANNTILCGETFFNEIKRLSGSQYIHIELKTNKFEVHDLPISYPIQKESVEDCAIKVADTLKNKAHCIYQALGNPAINMTGGLDARISLASYLSVGAKPFLNYGVGNSGLTNTKNEDLKIDLEFRNRYGLDLRIGSWKTSPIIDKYWNYYCSKYGFYSCVYTASKDVMEYFENSQGKNITFGYGGELYRNLPWIENRKKTFFNIDEFIDEYYLTGIAKMLTVDVPNFREHLRNKLVKICLKYNLDPNRISNVDNFYFLLEYRSNADTRAMNLINKMKFCNLLLTESECLKYARVEVANLRSSMFMLSIIKNLYSDVLEIPIFSHCQTRSYNKEKGMLSPESTPLKSKIKPFMPHFAINLYRKIHMAEKDAEINKDVVKFLSTQIMKFGDIPFAMRINMMPDLRKAIRYMQILHIIKSIMDVKDA